MSSDEIMKNGTFKIRKCVRLPLQDYKEAYLYTFYGCEEEEHIVIVFNKDVLQEKRPVVRIHSECLTGDVFASQRCDCHYQLHSAISFFKENSGILIYLKQEGRGVGLYNKIDAYALQDDGLDTFEANKKLNVPEDARSYECAAYMLKALGVNKIDLLTNNNEKIDCLLDCGIDVLRVPSPIVVNENNLDYIQAKVKRFNLEVDVKYDIT